jgi:hypothetical protein
MNEDYRQIFAKFRALPGRFEERRERAKNRATRWLCCEAVANESPLLRFPDPRGKYREFALKRPSPLAQIHGKREVFSDEFPAIRAGNFLLQTGKNIAPNSEY